MQFVNGALHPDVIVSPVTGRFVTKGSDVYKKLVKEGKIEPDPLAGSLGLIQECNKDELDKQLACYGKYAARGRGTLKGHYVARSLKVRQKRRQKRKQSSISKPEQPVNSHPVKTEDYVAPTPDTTLSVDVPPDGW